MKTLRGRMVLTLLGLAAVTLAITSIAGILILRALPDRPPRQ